jgi:hypothetical protein
VNILCCKVCESVCECIYERVYGSVCESVCECAGVCGCKCPHTHEGVCVGVSVNVLGYQVCEGELVYVRECLCDRESMCARVWMRM